MKIHVLDKKRKNHSYYVDELYLLNIDITNHTDCAGWTIRSATHNFAGKTIEELNIALDILRDIYKLEKRSEYNSDFLIIYTDDLTKIRGFLYDQIGDNDDHDKYIDINCVEFRSYCDWTKDTDLDIVFDTMKHWYETFINDKYFYFTPNQLNRKRIHKIMPDYCASVYPDNIQYNQIMRAVHGGVLYYNKLPATHGMLGFDIVSAYIYSFVFCKHVVSAPKNVNPADWYSYIGKADVGSIGIYEIEYNHPINNISCYKDLDDQPLESGHHTVMIALTNIDLEQLINMKHIQIISCNCKYLLDYKLDYLPYAFRKYCLDCYIEKCNQPKKTIAYINSKVKLNGIFGNLILTKVQKAYDKEYKNSHDVVKATKAADKEYDNLDRSTRPEWGVFTMAYCKKLVYTLGLQVSGWRYSDTDSIYCDDDSANRKLVEQFNNKIMAENYALCEQLGYMDYDMDKICKLGTFDLDAEIERFRVWGNKTYAYKTRPVLDKNGEVIEDSEYIIKAAGCNKAELPADDSIFNDENYKPSVGTRKYTGYDEHGYYETESYGELGLLRSLVRI